MTSFFSKAENLIKIIFGFTGIVMIFVETYAVVARNILMTTAAWTDETLKLLFVWCIFICSALAFLSDDLIGLNLIEEKLSSNKVAYTIIKVLQYVFALVLGVLLSTQAVAMLQTQMSTGEATPVVQFPLWIINLGFFIGVVLIVVFAVYKIFLCIKNLKA